MHRLPVTLFNLNTVPLFQPQGRNVSCTRHPINSDLDYRYKLMESSGVLVYSSDYLTITESCLVTNSLNTSFPRDHLQSLYPNSERYKLMESSQFITLPDKPFQHHDTLYSGHYQHFKCSKKEDELNHEKSC